MAKQNIKSVLSAQLESTKPSDAELKALKAEAKELVGILNSNLKKSKTSADVFIGGSFAKNTLIRKDKYDIDIFVRFDSKKYDDKEISSLLGKIVPKNAENIHGSRDYFRIKSAKSNVEFEIIPTLRIKNPSEAKNITDLSYFHVNYIGKQINKNKKLADEIRLAKAFAYFQDCYGAESYINGFSGYAVELLAVSYGSFVKFAEAVAKADVKKEKIILDPSKQFKNKQDILRELNESKLISPIVVIDPTFKQRNALAALSMDTFLKFQSACRSFIKNPSTKFFEHRDHLGNMRKKYGNRLIGVVLSTNKQAGDIAGTKLKKFYGFFIREIEKYFVVKDSLFEYDESDNTGKVYLAAEPKKEIIFSGPPLTMKEPLAKFKKEHKNIKVKAGKAYAVEKNNLDFGKFLDKFQNEKSKTIEEMDVAKIERLN